MEYAYLGLCVLVSVNMKAMPCFAPAVIPILHRSIVDGWMHVRMGRCRLGLILGLLVGIQLLPLSLVKMLGAWPDPVVNPLLIGWVQDRWAGV